MPSRSAERIFLLYCHSPMGAGAEAENIGDITDANIVGPQPATAEEIKAAEEKVAAEATQTEAKGSQPNP